MVGYRDLDLCWYLTLAFIVKISLCPDSEVKVGSWVMLSDWDLPTLLFSLQNTKISMKFLLWSVLLLPGYSIHIQSSESHEEYVFLFPVFLGKFYQQKIVIFVHAQFSFPLLLFYLLLPRTCIKDAKIEM